ncbi:MAG: hypothetical protein ACOX9C_09900, partial [Kiritimatiellia bacterium]
VEAVCARIYPPEAPARPETPAPPCASEGGDQEATAPSPEPREAGGRRPGSPRDAKGALKKQPARAPEPTSTKSSHKLLPRKDLDETAKKGA